MSYPVIAVHAIIRVPDGEKKQVQVAPGAKFKIGEKAEYEQLKAAGAIKDDAAAEKASADKPVTDKPAAEKDKAGGKVANKPSGAPSNDVIG